MVMWMLLVVKTGSYWYLSPDRLISIYFYLFIYLNRFVNARLEGDGGGGKRWEERNDNRGWTKRKTIIISFSFCFFSSLLSIFPFFSFLFFFTSLLSILPFGEKQRYYQ